MLHNTQTQDGKRTSVISKQLQKQEEENKEKRCSSTDSSAAVVGGFWHRQLFANVSALPVLSLHVCLPQQGWLQAGYCRGDEAALPRLPCLAGWMTAAMGRQATTCQSASHHLQQHYSRRKGGGQLAEVNKHKENATVAEKAAFPWDTAVI